MRLLADKGNIASVSPQNRLRIARALSVEWLGQTAASLFWITSMLAYGVTSTGDWLQILAASAWLLSNVAALVNVRSG